MEEFVQEYRKATRRSKYEKRLLIKKFKRGINRVIRRKIMETEQSSRSIEQQYERAINLDRHQRESKKEERLKDRREIEPQVQRVNTSEAQQQQMLYP